MIYKYKQSSPQNIDDFEDSIFKHLTRNLYRIREGIFSQSSSKKQFFIYSLNSGNHEDWILNNLLPNTKLIIQPKIIGSCITLFYRDGILFKGFNKNLKDITEKIYLIKFIPKALQIKKDILIRVMLFNQDGDRIINQKDSMNKKLDTINQLDFCAFQIINSNLNEFSQIHQLRLLGFKTPKTEATKSHTSEVGIYKDLWMRKKIFSNYPNEGMILKVNSIKLQKQLGESNGVLNWAFVIKSN